MAEQRENEIYFVHAKAFFPLFEVPNEPESDARPKSQILLSESQTSAF